jgi:hypothetical protein
MLNSVVSRTAAWVVSAVLGGYGVFCVYLSFYEPWVGLHALILLGTATAVQHFSQA